MNVFAQNSVTLQPHFPVRGTWTLLLKRKAFPRMMNLDNSSKIRFLKKKAGALTLSSIGYAIYYLWGVSRSLTRNLGSREPII